MRLGETTDAQENEHWAQVADRINRYWSEEFDRTQRLSPYRPAAPAVVAEHLATLSEIVADLARQMAEYHKWRAS